MDSLGGIDHSFFHPQLNIVLRCEVMDMELEQRVVCLFTAKLSVVLIMPIHGRMARLS